MIIHETYINLDETLIYKIMGDRLSKLLNEYQLKYNVDIHLEIYPDLSGVVLYSNTGEQVFNFDDFDNLCGLLEQCV